MGAIVRLKGKTIFVAYFFVKKLRLNGKLFKKSKKKQ